MTGPQRSLPCSSIAGAPLSQTSSRASASQSSGHDRHRVGAQMIGAVEAVTGEEWIRRQGVPSGPAWPPPPWRRASAGRHRRADRSAATSPRRPDRRAGQMQVEREMGKAVRDGGDRWTGGPLFAPLGARQRCHSAQHALGRTADEPDRAIPLDPPGEAVAMGPPALCLGRGEGFGSAAGDRPGIRSQGAGRQSGFFGRQIVAPRSIMAWAKSPGRPAGVIASANFRISSRAWSRGWSMPW